MNTVLLPVKVKHQRSFFFFRMAWLKYVQRILRAHHFTFIHGCFSCDEYLLFNAALVGKSGETRQTITCLHLHQFYTMMKPALHANLLASIASSRQAATGTGNGWSMPTWTLDCSIRMSRSMPGCNTHYHKVYIHYLLIASVSASFSGTRIETPALFQWISIPRQSLAVVLSIKPAAVYFCPHPLIVVACRFAEGNSDATACAVIIECGRGFCHCQHPWLIGT